MLSLVQRLPPDSLTVALMSGGREYFGWDGVRAALVDIYDAVNLNTRATGNWKPGKEPKFPLYPRPKATVSADTSKRVTSVAEVFAKFSGGL